MKCSISAERFKPETFECAKSGPQNKLQDGILCSIILSDDFAVVLRAGQIVMNESETEGAGLKKQVFSIVLF